MIDHSKGESPRPSQAPPTSRRWTVFALACGTSWFLYLHRYTWNFIEPKLTEEFDLTKTQTGVLGSLFNWTYCGFQIPSGIIADFFGPHLFLGLIIALWSVALSMHSFSSNLWFLKGVRLFFGLTQAGAYPSLTRVTHSWFPQESRTSIQGWVATFFGRGGGFMSSVLMGSLLMGIFQLSWQVSLLILSVAGISFAGLFLWLFRNSPHVDSSVNEAELALITAGDVSCSQGAQKKILPFSKAAQHVGMRFFVLQQFFNAGADNVYSLFMGSYFLTVKNVELTQAGLFVGLPLLGGAIGGMLGGICNDLMIRWTNSRRWGRSIIGFSGKAIACVLMFVAISQNNPLHAGIALFAVKFFSDWSQPTVWGACTDLGKEYSASVFSIINTSGAIGGVICPPLFGFVLDRFATKQLRDGVEVIIPGFNELFILVAAMYIVSALSWFVINCEKPIEEAVGPNLNSQ